MEVVVADVVVEHLVVPDDLAGGAVQDDQRVRVERAAGEPGAVREPRRPAPRARVRDADVDTALRVDRHRVPRPTPAGVLVRPGLRDRLEPPESGVPSVRRARRRLHARWAGSRRSRSTRDRDRRRGRCRRTCSVLLARRRCQEILARPGVQGERRRVRSLRAAPARRRRPRRSARRSARSCPRPPHAARTAVERDDIRLPGLEVDRVADDDGGGREPTPKSVPSPGCGSASARRGGRPSPA